MGFQDAAVVPKRSQVCRSFLRLKAAGNHLRLEPIRQGHHPFQGARGLKHLREREFDRADKSKSHGWIPRVVAALTPKIHLITCKALRKRMSDKDLTDQYLQRSQLPTDILTEGSDEH